MNCPTIPELSLSEFGQRLAAKLHTNRFPLSGSLELTERCNLRCVHCYINQPAGDTSLQRRELSTFEVCDLLEQMAEAGCLKLLITGGEPLLRPDFLEIYIHAKRQGLLITLFTNGTLITQEIADVLAEYPPYSIEITLYGASDETYRQITGSAGAFRRCLNAIDLLKERHLPLKLKSMVLKGNQDDLPAMQAMAEQFEVFYRYDAVLNTRLNGDHGPLDHSISVEDVLQLDKADDGRAAEIRQMLRDIRRKPTRPDELYGCGAGVYSFHINAYGQLSLCLMSRSPAYDLRQGSFRDGWEQFLPQARFQKRIRQTACQQCDLSALCGQCPGMAEMQYGDPEEPLHFTCAVAHRRAQEFAE